MSAAIAKSPAPATASTDWIVALERGCGCGATACIPGGAGGGADAAIVVEAIPVGVGAMAGTLGGVGTSGTRLSTASRARSAVAAALDASHSSIP
ncbi:hypothetical protein GCM10027421_19690 [Microbacterium shaanxiense]